MVQPNVLLPGARKPYFPDRCLAIRKPLREFGQRAGFQLLALLRCNFFGAALPRRSPPILPRLLPAMPAMFRQELEQMRQAADARRAAVAEANAKAKLQ